MRFGSLLQHKVGKNGLLFLLEPLASAYSQCYHTGLCYWIALHYLHAKNSKPQLCVCPQVKSPHLCVYIKAQQQPCCKQSLASVLLLRLRQEAGREINTANTSDNPLAWPQCKPCPESSGSIQKIPTLSEPGLFETEIA